MLIYPAIDLAAGRCVRLRQGRFDQATIYSDDPFRQLAAFAEAGAQWAHIVDLDGAAAGRPVQHDLIARLSASSAVHLQVGGGVRARADIAALLDAGVARVVIGSAAVRRPGDVRAWIAAFGLERICAAFDVRAGEIAVDGWAAGAGRSLDEALALYPEGALKHALVTDIARDGVLAGPNTPLIAALIAARPDLAVQASGGVAALADLAALRAAGATAAIVGRALYERCFTLEAALAG